MWKTPQERYDELVAAVIEILPADQTKVCMCSKKDGCPHKPYVPSIALEELLVALHEKWKSKPMYSRSYVMSMMVSQALNNGWVLCKDLAWHQAHAPQAIQFFHSMLLDS